MPNTINLTPLNTDYIQQGRARLVQVVQTENGERELEVGVVSVAEVEVSADTTDVYTSNLPVRTKIGSLTNEVSAKLPFTVQSLTPEVRAWSVLGLEQAAPLVADPAWTKEIGAWVPGDRVPFGRPVENVEVEGAVEGVDFKMLDNNMAMLIMAKPSGLATPVEIIGSATAFPDALKVSVGRNANRVIRLRLYGVEQVKRPYILDMTGIVRPSSAVGYIGENDIIGAEFELDVQTDTDGNLGILTIF